MEIPSKVSVFNKTLEFKGKPGMLIAINDLGFYEIIMEVQQRNHTVLFPIGETTVRPLLRSPPTSKWNDKKVPSA